jgi:CHAT domain-containing protein
LLQVKEILGLNLSAELFIIPSSQPAGARHSSGDSVNSLSWSLFIAGCPSLIIGQWPTNSVSTTELMLELHRNLGASTPGPVLSKTKYLQRAIVGLLKNAQFQHPFYWAGLSLVGDYR